MSEQEKRTCCYVGRDGEGKPFGDYNVTGARECGHEADFEIQNTTPGADFYDVVDACEKHIGQMLGSSSTDKEGHTIEANQWRVVFIGTPDTRRPF